MKRIQSRILSALIVAVIGIGIGFVGITETYKDNDLGQNISASKEEITWVQNEDGSYIFTNNAGDENSIYAWYVLDETGEAVYKTKYSDSPKFTYDLGEKRNLIIKGFIRTGTEEEYDQTSMKVYATDILGPIVYSVKTVNLPENVHQLLRDKILKSGQATLPVESVLARDGRAWEVDLTLPVDWECPDITNRSHGVETNGLLFLDETYREYCDTENIEYAELIMSYVADWAEQNQKYDPDKEWIWHDDATALRVLRMSIFYNEFKELCTKKEQKEIEDSLAYQAELLSKDEFYTKKHNHGMHQDMALLIYALLFPDGETQEQYISKALSRTGDYLDYVYTDDGIHKEHSPSYARDVLADIVFLQVLVKDISPDFSNHVSCYVDSAQKYLIQILEPDGSWPSLGDSRKIDGMAAIKNIVDHNAEYLYLTSGGSEGTIPPKEMVFDEGGYAIFRSSWEEAADEATWMMFLASTFSSTHKHGDDLEVLLYHKGDLFVEAGKRNYNYSDEMTAWAYSGYGHNVLLVNGEAYPGKVGKNGFQSIYPEALQTGIRKSNLSDEISSVTGKQYRFDNVEQERTLIYDKTKDIVTVSDVLEAQENFDGTLLYHIAEGVRVEENSVGWNLYRDNELVAVVSVEGDVDFEISTVIGEGVYPYCTWIFNGKDEPAYGSLLMVNIFGEMGESKINTIIELK